MARIAGDGCNSGGGGGGQTNEECVCVGGGEGEGGLARSLCAPVSASGAALRGEQCREHAVHKSLSLLTKSCSTLSGK